MPEGADQSVDYVEVYHTDSPIVAQKILDVLLVPGGVRAHVHDRKESMFPGQGLPGGVFITVPRDQEAAARQIIGEAHENGFLDAEEGELIPTG